MTDSHRVTVLVDEPVATINPFLHGHFAEHLGELVYPGIYIPPDSAISNKGGIRNDVVNALKPLGIPILRWPGGCFADNYHWRDGIGPAEQRPMRINAHWGMAEEPNSFGTHEFVAFCRAIGAEPYFAGNLGSAPPSEMRDWVEYSNFGGNSALAAERRANGAAEPFQIKFWGIGNENWGCGGNMSGAEYAGVFARYQSYVYSYPGAPVERIACGPNGPDWDWTENFFDAITAEPSRARLTQAFAAHYYCGTAGTATAYTESQWLELLTKAASIEGVLTGHRAIMDRYDPERKVKLICDEWGAWHPVETGKPEGGLYQQNTMRDALVAALSLDAFHRNADKLFMANIAQLINVLQALLLVEGAICVKTPTYHVYDLYKPHKGATSLRTVIASNVISRGEASEQFCRSCYRDGNSPGLQFVTGSASVQGGLICVTLVNAHPTESAEVEIDFRGRELSNLETATLASSDIHDYNTFGNPDCVTLRGSEPPRFARGLATLTLPAASVSRVMGTIT